MLKLVLFIHGLGGDAEGTWQKFPKLIEDDIELSTQFDVAMFEYTTGKLAGKPSLALCAQSLITEINNRYASFVDITLIAHSQGGLIAKYCIAKLLDGIKPCRVKKLLTFATPHSGSGLAHPAKLLSMVLNTQIDDLDPNSNFLRELSEAWGKANPQRHVRTKFVAAAEDVIVGQVSAMGQWNSDYEVMSKVGHGSIVKPDSVDHSSFIIAKKFLLENDALIGSVEADYRAPLLRLNYLEINDANRFIYGARVLPLFGRKAEIEGFSRFFGNPEQPLRWMIMHGSGGVGKSRLALDLCLALRSEWHAGFLPQDGKEPDWGTWQPMLPTLIMIDYAARDPERTGKMLRALAGRCREDGTALLAAPVRIVLLERTGSGDWLDKVVGTGTTKARVNAAHAGTDLALNTIDDCWPIFEYVLNKASKPLPDKADTLANFAQIDIERRPLFAYFMADAIARGDDVRHFDAAQLLDLVIDRNRKAFWQPAGATAKDERLLALATMTNGISVAVIRGLAETLLPKWDVDTHPAIFGAMTGRPAGERVHSMEPDIVGEHFALSILESANLSEADRARLCDLAWRLEPFNMAQFSERAHRDLPTNPMLLWLRSLPTTRGLPQLGWAVTSANLLYKFGVADSAVALELLGNMRDAAEEYDDAGLWSLWAKGAVNVLSYLAAANIASAQMLNRLMHVTARMRNEESLWEAWAQGAYNVFGELCRADMQAAMQLLDQLREAAGIRKEAVLWELWARSAVQLLADVGVADLAVGQMLLDDLFAITNERGESKLWVQLAKGAANFLRSLSAVDCELARKLLIDLRAIAVARNDPIFWEAWARGVMNMFDNQVFADLEIARALLDDLREIARGRDERALLLPWVCAAFFLVKFTYKLSPDSAMSLMRDILQTPRNVLLSVLSEELLGELERMYKKISLAAD